MSQQVADILYHAFTFLDYSHTTTLSLVCKEWNQIANSNQLWEFYFHLLSNNKKGKTKVKSKTISSDELFWKHKMRDCFSKYVCKVSKKLTPLVKDLNLKILERSFPDQFSAQVVKMILSRILLESVGSSEQLGASLLPPKLDRIFYQTSEEYFRLKFRISGIDEPLIARWFSGEESTLHLFGYDYTDGFYLYFAKESDDKLNEKFMNLEMDFKNLALQERSFIFKFDRRNAPSLIYGTRYLCDNILSVIVPTVRQYEFSPYEFIPYWCLLFSIIISQLIYNPCSHPFHKEIVKHYPNLIFNRLAHHFLSKLYEQRINSLPLRLFNTYTPTSEIQAKLLKCIKSNKPIPPLNVRKRLEASQLKETIQIFTSTIKTSNLKFLWGGGPITALSEEEQFQIQAQALAKMYTLYQKNSSELINCFLLYKFGRDFQIGSNSDCSN